MPADQFNLRLRDTLDHQVRVKAAELGCKPRDVVEEALVAFYGFTRVIGDPQPERLPLEPAASTLDEAAPEKAGKPASESPPEAAAEALPAAAKGGCPECGGDYDDRSDHAVCKECGNVWVMA